MKLVYIVVLCMCIPMCIYASLDMPPILTNKRDVILECSAYLTNATCMEAHVMNCAWCPELRMCVTYMPCYNEYMSPNGIVQCPNATMGAHPVKCNTMYRQIWTGMILLLITVLINIFVAWYAQSASEKGMRNWLFILCAIMAAGITAVIILVFILWMLDEVILNKGLLTVCLDIVWITIMVSGGVYLTALILHLIYKTTTWCWTNRSMCAINPADTRVRTCELCRSDDIVEDRRGECGLCDNIQQQLGECVRYIRGRCCPKKVNQMDEYGLFLNEELEDL